MSIPKAYEGREQSYLKHLVLKQYLEQWAHKLGSAARRTGSTLWYVDAFAGPWNQKSPELEDTSVAIGIKALESAAATWARRGINVRARALFVEKNRAAFAQLQRFLAERTGSVETTEYCGTFGEHSTRIGRQLGRDAAFIFVDPTGWKGAAMNYIAPLVAGGGPRDVLVNVMFDHINRQKDREEAHLRKQMREFFGLRDSDLPRGLSEHELLELYRQQLKEKCTLPHAANVVVPHPTRRRTKFHLVAGGKHPAVLEVFRNVEQTVLGRAAAPIRDDAARRTAEQRTGQLSLLRAPPPKDDTYLVLHDRDVPLTVKDVKRALEHGPGRFSRIWPAILEKRHITKAELASITWDLHRSGEIVVRNLEPRQRTIKDDHLLALPDARR